LTAAKIKLIGETVGAARHERGRAFAHHRGVAPTRCSRKNTAGWVQMTRWGSRQRNAGLNRIAVAQIRLNGQSQT
jgi:hypothetical protein